MEVVTAFCAGNLWALPVALIVFIAFAISKMRKHEGSLHDTQSGPAENHTKQWPSGE